MWFFPVLEFPYEDFLCHRNCCKYFGPEGVAFHRDREAIAAKLMAFYWIQSVYNLSDMLSKHWDHPTVYPMILKLLITRGNITLIPKKATQEKEKENLKLQPEKLKKREKDE